MKQHLPIQQQPSPASLNFFNVSKKQLQRYLFCLLCCVAPALCFAQDLSHLKDTPPVVFSGGISLTGIDYRVSGIPNRRAPFTYLLTGDPTFNFYGLTVPLSFTVSQADRSFRQPFNEYGMSPTYKWITLHAGYRSLEFSPYTLGGHTMLGAGVELNPGKLRAGFMYGRLNSSTTIDTTRQALVPFSFSRKGYAARLGYGSDRNFFEMSYLSAKDDSLSAPADVPAPYQLTAPTPAKNNVVGYRSKFSFLKVFTFESDGALSLYTTDLNSKLSVDSLGNDFLKKVKSLFGLNASSEYYTAFSAALGYRSKKYGMKVSYKRIEPDFKTMGAYYFNSDLENWTIIPNASLFKNKVRFNGTFGIQHDNLRQQKRAENRRIIANANLSVEVTPSLGFDLIYSNFSDNQQPRSALIADSLRIVQTTQTIGFNPRYFIIGTDVTHAISASVNHSSLNDFNNYFNAQSAGRNITTNQYFVNYTIGFPKRALSLFINLNETRLTGAGLASTFTGATLGGNTAFFKQKLQTALTSSFTQSSANQAPGSFIINVSGNIRYQTVKKQSAGLSLFITSNRTKSANYLQPNFTESRAELSYQINF